MQVKTFLIEGELYQVVDFNVVEGIKFCNKLMPKIKPLLSFFDGNHSGSPKVAEIINAAIDIFADEDSAVIMEMALKQVVTPCGKLLKNADVFETYLKEHSSEVYEIAANATIELVRDFLPKKYATILNSIIAEWKGQQTQTKI